MFDIDRLDFFNSYYLKNIPIWDLYEKFINYLEKYDKKFLNKIFEYEKQYNIKILSELKTRIKKFSDYKELSSFFYDEPVFNEDIVKLIKNEKMGINNLDLARKWLKLFLETLKQRKK